MFSRCSWAACLATQCALSVELRWSYVCACACTCNPCTVGTHDAGPDFTRSSNPLRDITLGNWSVPDLTAPEVAGVANPYFVESITDGLASSILSAAETPNTVAHMEDLLSVGSPAVTEEQLADLRNRGWYVPGAPPTLPGRCRVRRGLLPAGAQSAVRRHYHPDEIHTWRRPSIQWRTAGHEGGPGSTGTPNPGTTSGYSESGGGVVRRALACCGRRSRTSDLRWLRLLPALLARRNACVGTLFCGMHERLLPHSSPPTRTPDVGGNLFTTCTRRFAYFVPW